LIAESAIAQVTATTFYTNDDKKRDVVTFTSKAPLETIVGRTGDIVGFVDTDPADILNSRARFEVDLATMKTGIDVRDGHMRDQYLETKKYPKAVFELTRVVTAEQTTLNNQKSVQLTVEGNFNIHGITRLITIPMTITYYRESEHTQSKLPGDILRIQAAWDILLSDYKIARPQFIIMKLDDKQHIDVNIFASTGSPAVSFASTGQSQ
jgi:polyisoprenoid-binding protein YceI